MHTSLCTCMSTNLEAELVGQRRWMFLEFTAKLPLKAPTELYILTNENIRELLLPSLRSTTALVLFNLLIFVNLLHGNGAFKKGIVFPWSLMRLSIFYTFVGCLRFLSLACSQPQLASVLSFFILIQKCSL